MSALKRPKHSRAMYGLGALSTSKEGVMALESGQRSPLRGGLEFFKETVTSLQKEPPLPSQPAMGFFTDTSLCIGCKACEIACKQWNELPATTPSWSGTR